MGDLIVPSIETTPPSANTASSSITSNPGRSAQNHGAPLPHFTCAAAPTDVHSLRRASGESAPISLMRSEEISTVRASAGATGSTRETADSATKGGQAAVVAPTPMTRRPRTVSPSALYAKRIAPDPRTSDAMSFCSVQLSSVQCHTYPWIKRFAQWWIKCWVDDGEEADPLDHSRTESVLK